ncbi:uncharacterized protein [Spinacia oleracea]|uniref:RNase H type-1 domain-containing protein n=1 Tax=Spinacia oleracea TaxID=3562 RepID=A0ABM3RNY8_SPIOL|nr:uncharacterized protein LOC130471303 [Spinacia oleracea]
MPSFDPDLDLYSNIQNLKQNVSTENLEKITIGWWFIWFIRNSVTFKQESFSSSQACILIRNFIKNWRNSLNHDMDDPSQTTNNLENVNPFGFIIRDEKGELILAEAKAIHNSYSILQAEAMGLREGLKGALFLGIKNLIIEGDNLVVVNSINRVWQIPWEINNIICDAEMDLTTLESFSVRHCFREANQAADFMANQGHTTPDLRYWFSSFAPPLSLIIRKDALGWPTSRA